MARTPRRRLVPCVLAVGFGSVWVNDDQGRVCGFARRADSGFSLHRGAFRASPEETGCGRCFDRARQATPPKGAGPCSRLALLVPAVVLAPPLRRRVARSNRPHRSRCNRPSCDSGSRRPSPSTGFTPRRLEVQLEGATDPSGAQLSWRSLRLVGDTWHGTLPAPALRGVYRVVLRAGSGAAPVGSRQSFLRVFAPGTGARPSFADPVDVVRWWAHRAPRDAGRAEAVAATGIRSTRPRLHRLFVVAYSPPGHPDVNDRLGMFVTAVRDGYGGRWRLLEATLQP